MKLALRPGPAVSAALAVLALSRPARADVWTVDDDLPADFGSIQAAIDAAVDGDTILVRVGDYGGFTLEGKALSIVGDGPGWVGVVSGVRVRNVAAGKVVVLEGIKAVDGAQLGMFEFTNVAGSVRCETLRTESYLRGHGAGVHVENCADVVLTRCQVVGQQGGLVGSSFLPGQPGVRAIGSTIALYDCDARGGKGAYGGNSGVPSSPGSAGGDGFGGVDASVFVASSFFVGGQGGGGSGGSPGCVTPPGPGGAGGDGFDLEASAPQASIARLLEVSAVAGAGGPGGPGDGTPGCFAPAGAAGVAIDAPPGGLVVLLGPMRAFSAPNPVRELTSVPLHFQGQPGDVVLLVVSPAAAHVFHAPFEGVVLYGAPARRAVVGTIDGTGFLDVPLHVPELGPGVEATTRHMQALFRDVAGQAVLSWPVTQVVLDQAF